MLELDFYHTNNENEDINVQFTPEDEETIPMLRELLNSMNIKNPLVTFSERYKGEFYEACSEDYIKEDAWACDTLSFLWKEQPDDKGKHHENVMVILERLTNAYLREHFELVQLRGDFGISSDGG